MEELLYSIKVKIGTISSSKGWTKELNIISWNGKEGKYDIRSWTDDHSKMSKGLTMTKTELLKLKEILDKIDFNDKVMSEDYNDIGNEDLLDEI